MYKRPVAYICSPYKGNIQSNAAKAREYSRTAYEHGFTPIAPHLLFTQFMDDNIPEERSDALLMNKVLVRKANIMFVCGDVITDGMKAEMIYARRMGLTVVPLDGVVQIEKYLKGES